VSWSAARLSPGARFACWFAAYARADTSLDEALDAITGDDAAHHLVGLDESADGADGADAATPLALGLGRLRARILDQAERPGHVALSLPASGDPAGLAGPADFNADAVEAGEAVLLGGAGLGLIPARVGAGVFWRVRPAAAPPPPDLGEADRGLRSVLREVADTLAALDLAQWQPDVADALLNLRRSGGPHLPPGMDPRAVAVATTASRCRAIVDLARQTEGAAVTGYDADARDAGLRPLDRAARRALAAACSAPVSR
jgi:hypothetical protein